MVSKASAGGEGPGVPSRVVGGHGVAKAAEGGVFLNNQWGLKPLPAPPPHEGEGPLIMTPGGRG